MALTLTAEKGLIFRITHKENVPWILDNGMHARNGERFDPNYRNIGNVDLIGRRSRRAVAVPPGGTLSDYVPFYFTPYSIMMYNINTGHGGVKRLPNDEIVIFVSSLPRVAAQAEGSFSRISMLILQWRSISRTCLSSIESTGLC